MSTVPWGAMRGEKKESSSQPTTNGFHSQQSNQDSGSNGMPHFDVKVGSVSVSVTKEDLTAMFESVGEVLRVNILAPRDGHDTTLAFVRYGDRSDAENAVENLNGFELDGKEIRVEIAQPRGDRPPRDGPSKPFRDSNDTAPRFSDSEGKQIRVLNIPCSYGEDEVTSYFQASGNVVSVRLLPPKDGYDSAAGFVTFSEVDEANAAVENQNGAMLEGKTLRIEIAKSRSQNQPRQGSGQSPFGGGGGSVPPWQQSSQGGSRSEDRVCRRCNKPGHLSFDCTEPPACHKCGSPDHLARSCTALHQDGGDGRMPSGGGDGACFRCGEQGHFSRECTVVDENAMPPVTYVPAEITNDDIFSHTTAQGINFEKYQKIPVEITGAKVVQPISSFGEAALNAHCLKNIEKAKYVTPTPVQKYAIPAVLAGRDLMACAQTGSGKTAAFLLPMISKIIENGIPPEPSEDYPVHPLAVIIAPTRELAVQIHMEVRKFTYGTQVRSCVVYGGVSVNHQSTMMCASNHIIVATPGRLEDFIKRGKVTFSQLIFFVLDEADRMLDMGFLPSINNIRDNSNMPPKHCLQTLMFSATFPEEIQRLAAEYLNDYLFLTVGRLGSTSSDIEQTIMEVPSMSKRDRLERILNETGKDRTLVFVELKRNADFLASFLSSKTFPTTSISSDRSQEEREAALSDFRKGEAYVMVATAVAARGLDIEGVKHVINFDLPQTIDEYVHRIGRTGRIGNKGKATSFYDESRDERLARGLVKVLSEASQVVPEWLENVAMSAVGTGYGPAGGKFTSRDTREGGYSRGQNTRFSNGGQEKRDERPAHNGFQRSPMQAVSLDQPSESWD